MTQTANFFAPSSQAVLHMTALSCFVYTCVCVCVRCVCLCVCVCFRIKQADCDPDSVLAPEEKTAVNDLENLVKKGVLTPSQDSSGQYCFSYSAPVQGQYLEGCVDECKSFETLDEAQSHCNSLDDCGGVTHRSLAASPFFAFLLASTSCFLASSSSYFYCHSQFYTSTTYDTDIEVIIRYRY